MIAFLILTTYFPRLVRGARPSPTLGRRVFQTTALSVLKVPKYLYYNSFVILSPLSFAKWQSAMSVNLPNWLVCFGKNNSWAFRRHSSHRAVLFMATDLVPPPLLFLNYMYFPLQKCFQPNSTLRVDFRDLWFLSAPPTATLWSPSPLAPFSSFRHPTLSSKLSSFLGAQKALRARRSPIVTKCLSQCTWVRTVNHDLGNGAVKRAISLLHCKATLTN